MLIGCSTARPIKGDNGWDGIKLYKPYPDQQKFISSDNSEVNFKDLDKEYLLISVEDYLEIIALIDSAVLWNRKMFFEYLKAKPP